MQCPRWPIRDHMKLVNFDGVLGAGTTRVFFGPQGPANTNLAWVVFLMTFSYSTPLVAASFVTPYYQYNNAPQERLGPNRVVMSQFPSDTNNIFPIVGGGATLDSATGLIYSGRPKPIYVPFPDELVIEFAGTAGHEYQIRGLVLEVPKEVDVSMFL